MTNNYTEEKDRSVKKDEYRKIELLSIIIIINNSTNKSYKTIENKT